MPCASKRCSLCGGSHNIRTCKLPGAAKFRELVVQQHKPRKPLKGRKLRGHKPAVLSRKPARQVKRNTDKKTRKDFRTKQRLLYSGDKIQHGNRADRRSQKDNVADLLDPDRTTEKLLHLGYIQRPERCGKCGLRSVQGPFSRYNVCQHARYWRCDQHDCKHWMNVLQGAKWIEGVERFRALTPSRLWHMICRYTDLTCPTRQTVASGLGSEGPKIAQTVMDALRTLEAEDGKRMNSRLAQTGDCEVDGTSLRTLRIARNNPHWRQEIDDWMRHLDALSTVKNCLKTCLKDRSCRTYLCLHACLHGLIDSAAGKKKKEKPKYFLTHLRWGGCVERGSNGRLSLCKLDFVLLPPAAKPVTESLADVKKSHFLERLQKPVTVFADGAKAWKTESRRLRLTFRNVVHYKMEFCRKTKVKKKQVKISGTQKLDQRRIQ